MKKALEDVYNEIEKKRSKTFIFYEKKKWNDVLNNFRIPLGEYDYRRMLCAKEVLYSKEEFENMFKFTIVRNPYDRAVSTWKYLIKGDIKWNLANMLTPKLAFRKFLEILPKVWKNIRFPGCRHWATHTAPIIPDIIDRDGTFLVDFVGKLENISKDFRYICEKIGNNERDFPAKNVTSKKRHYSYYYTKKYKKLVQKYYKKDIERLDYEFKKRVKYDK